MARERHSEEKYKGENSSTENFDDFIQGEVTAGISALLSQYLKMEKMKKYLVDGAILQCSKSTLEPFKVPHEPDIILNNIAGESQVEQKKREQTRLYVRKEDGKMTDVESLFATIYDSKKGELSALSEEEETKSEGPNIYPFRCNCEVEIDRDAEKEIIEKHRTECAVNGVCQYLMDLNDTWENWLSDQGELYEEKEIKDGDGNVIIAECITMTSMLFCKHGGLITPFDPGQLGRIMEEVFFTREELRSCGWETITAVETDHFNLALLDFGVTTRASACMLLATMLSESSNCTEVLEGGEGCDNPEGWAEYQKETGQRQYNYTERGAGYIQLTWRDTHRWFLEDMTDPYQEENTARYIANEYPIEASVWYWTTFYNTEEGNLNEYINKYGASTDTFLVVQYYVNGFQNAKEHMKEIQSGKYEIQPIEGSDEEAEVIINGVSYRGPWNLQTRIQNWEKVKGLL